MSNVDAEIFKKFTVMKSLAFFTGFDDRELLEVAMLSDFVKFGPGDYIVKEGEPGNSFCIILKGTVSVTKTDPILRKHRTLTRITKGECFGEMSIISGKPRTADIVADDEVFIYRIGQETISRSRDALQLQFYRRFCEILVERLTRTSEMAARNEK